MSRLALTDVAGTTNRPLALSGLYRQLYAVTPADTTLTPLVEKVFLRLLTDVAFEVQRAWDVRS